MSLQAEFFAWARQEMKRRKVKRNVLSFDDMLTRLDEALSGEGGEAALGRHPRAIQSRLG